VLDLSRIFHHNRHNLGHLHHISLEASNKMGRTKRPLEDEPKPPNNVGDDRVQGPTRSRHSIRLSQFKPTSMTLWDTVAEQYRIACGELETRPGSVLKNIFFKKMCNSMKKPTGSSGVDDMTAKFL
jgi:hypothetical protein